MICACTNETWKCGENCCIPFKGVVAAAAGGFVMLVLILVLSICLCRVRRRAKKLVAWKGGAEPEEHPDVHYASLQNLASARVGEQQPEPPGPHNTDYATVAEVKGLGEECGEGEGWPDGGADPGELVRDPQEGVATN